MKIFQRRVFAEKWGHPQVCTDCGWMRKPEDPWTLANALFPPKKCPKCKGKLARPEVSCPKCGQAPPKLRFPSNKRMVLWGGFRCKHCNIEIDKWGKQIADQ